MFYRGRKGFTLIELIVVMAIMAILSTISFVSIQYVVQQNAYKAYEGKCVAAIESCKTTANLLNQVVGEFPMGSTVHVAPGVNVTTTNFKSMLTAMGGIPSGYDIQIRTENTAPSISASTKDLIVVYISGMNQPLNRDLDLEVKGAWFIKKGSSTPASTYNYSNRTAYNDSRSVTA